LCHFLPDIAEILSVVVSRKLLLEALTRVCYAPRRFNLVLDVKRAVLAIGIGEI
jgi:hypothetical protein